MPNVRPAVTLVAVCSILLALLMAPPAMGGKLTFGGLEFKLCLDLGVCTFTIPGVHPLLGKNIDIRIRGIEAPSVKGACQAETLRARTGQGFLNKLLRKAKVIDVYSAERGKRFELVADLYADDKEVASILEKAGFVRFLDGGEPKGWCP